ncbi:secreted RxLR effector protein 161-like [Vigna angularis]|uniref:secreted RxLR effector protein 161-like n=1 Tax=Phaseolus angularis TaxID=3914 RepID=UPI0022B514DE|nr:secreted RxLR effector protein 161-like [Vigna angularis]
MQTTILMLEKNSSKGEDLPVKEKIEYEHQEISNLLHGWVIMFLAKLDVKSAFLHGDLNEDVYVEQPKGYEMKGYKMSKDGTRNFVDETYYKQLVSSLMYLTATRPDMMFVTFLISRYMAKPLDIHLQVAKRALRYLKGTVNYGIYYKTTESGELLAFTDSDYAGDMEDRKSTSGYVFLMGLGVVSWCSKKQPIVTLSTTEAEFVATVVCAC